MFRHNRRLILVLFFLLCLFLTMSFVSADDNITDDGLEGADCDDSLISLDQSGGNNRVNSFKNLQNLINNSISHEINIYKDYTYHEGDNPIIIDKSIVINGNNHTLNALNKSSIFIIKSNDVVIRNLNFLNAGCGEFNLSTHGEDSFDAVIVDDFNIFKDYRNYLITDSTHHIGGAIYSAANSLVISGCKFENNHASLGGAIYSNCGNLFIDNVDFINNHAYCGAAIYLNATNSTISNSRFLNNNASSFGSGIYQKKDNVKIINSTFLNNHAEDNSTLFLLDNWEFSGINLTYYNSFIVFK